MIKLRLLRGDHPELGQALHPTAHESLREEKGRRQDKEEKPYEGGWDWSGAATSQGTPVATGIWKRPRVESPSKSPEKKPAPQHLDFTFLVSRTSKRDWLSVIWVCCSLLWQLQETHTMTRCSLNHKCISIKKSSLLQGKSLVLNQVD